MKRKPGELIPIERSILATAVRLSSQGVEEFHGFRLAKEIRDRDGARRLMGQGTLYRALARLEEQGILQSMWEDPAVAAEEHRPRRRLYRLTGAHVVGWGETPVPRQGRHSFHGEPHRENDKDGDVAARLATGNG